jgi:hypothetical protein
MYNVFLCTVEYCVAHRNELSELLGIGDLCGMSRGHAMSFIDRRVSNGRLAGSEPHYSFLGASCIL